MHICVYKKNWNKVEQGHENVENLIKTKNGANDPKLLNLQFH